MDYKKQESTSKTPDPDEEQFLHYLLLYMNSTTVKQKSIFEIGAMRLMEEVLEDTGSDKRYPRD
jgi:hypothetical protein